MATINQVRVVSVNGRHLTLHLDHVYGWHWKSLMACSRTMALQILWDMRTGSAPLEEAFAQWDGTDEVWNAENVDRFISCVGMVDRRHCYEMRSDEDHEYWDTHESDALPVPQATFLIAVSDPNWLAHLIPGMEWSSTAYNHDHSVHFDRAWRTTDVALLANSIAESQEFGGLPILADALQEAGCDNSDILAHFRDPKATHIRGCWALDLVLGKE